MNDFEMNDLLEEEETLSFSQKIIAIISDPKKAFDAIAKDPKLLEIFILITILSIVPLLINFLDGSSKQLIMDQLQQSGQVITDDILKYAVIVGLMAGIVFSVFTPLIGAFFYHIVAMIQSHSGYKKTLSIFLYSSVIGSLGAWIVLLISKLTGTTIMFSPAMFVNPVQTSPVLYTLLASLDVFAIWTLVVMYIGFKSVHGMNKKEATLSVLAPYVILTLFAMGMMLLFT